MMSYKKASNLLTCTNIRRIKQQLVVRKIAIIIIDFIRIFSIIQTKIHIKFQQT